MCSSDLQELTATIAEIEKHYKKAQQFRQKLQAVSRSMKPKMHRSLRWGLARAMVQVSRLIRGIAFSSITRRALAGTLRRVVDELRPIEKEIAKVQRKLEQTGSAQGQAAVLRKELRQHSQQIQQLEEESGASSAELRRTLQIVERGDRKSTRLNSSH